METSLYLHIPFCLSKCDYCDFFSVPSSQVPEEYLDAVIKEADYYKEKYSVSFWKTIYIGGGTPSLLSEKQIEKLLTSLKPEGAEEVCMEMNPETLTEEKLLRAEGNGVTRLSLGVQSLCEKSLCSVHRHCSREIALKKLELVKKHWKGRLNLDAIAGLPEDDDKSFLNTLSTLLDFSPDHISLYTLTLEEGTPLEKRISCDQAFDFDEADRKWILGRDFLEKQGFLQYEVSNFAKKGFESKHNLSYWHQKNYVGAGCAACGTIYDFSKDLASAERWENTRDIKAYTKFWNSIERENLPQEKEYLSLEELEFEFLMMGLRTLEGVKDSDYKKRFSFLEPWHGDLEKRLNFLSEGKVSVTSTNRGEKNYALTKESILFLNQILREL